MDKQLNVSHWQLCPDLAIVDKHQPIRALQEFGRIYGLIC